MGRFRNSRPSSTPECPVGKSPKKDVKVVGHCLGQGGHGAAREHRKSKAGGKRWDPAGGISPFQGVRMAIYGVVVSPREI